tara:strand:- start:136 stop:402 length:267 start_codon:yes stop_codon:yes gene_type:complete
MSDLINFGQGEDGSIIINHIAECDGFSIHYRNNDTKNIILPQLENSMIYEVQVFAESILNKTCYDAQRTLLVIQLLTEIRHQCGIKCQ